MVLNHDKHSLEVPVPGKPLTFKDIFMLAMINTTNGNVLPSLIFIFTVSLPDNSKAVPGQFSQVTFQHLGFEQKYHSAQHKCVKVT